MSEKKTEIKHYHSSGMIWFVGWLFTIGYVQLGFWKGLLALLLWPYYLGTHFAGYPALSG